MHFAVFADEVAMTHGDVPAIVQALRESIEGLEVPVGVEIGPAPKHKVDAFWFDEFAPMFTHDREPLCRGFEVVPPIDATGVHRIVISGNEERLAIKTGYRFGGKRHCLGCDAIVIEEVASDNKGVGILCVGKFDDADKRTLHQIAAGSPFFIARALVCSEVNIGSVNDAQRFALRHFRTHS